MRIELLSENSHGRPTRRRENNIKSCLKEVGMWVRTEQSLVAGTYAHWNEASGAMKHGELFVHLSEP